MLVRKSNEFNVSRQNVMEALTGYDFYRVSPFKKIECKFFNKTESIYLKFNYDNN